MNFMFNQSSIQDGDPYKQHFVSKIFERVAYRGPLKCLILGKWCQSLLKGDADGALRLIFKINEGL